MDIKLTSSPAFCFDSLAITFRSDDLRNPSTIDQLVKAAADELVKQQFSEGCPIDRDHISRWIQNDPFLRESILCYVNKILR
jgi:hypothetical protein